MTKGQEKTYDSIKTIEGLAAIRLRPGMYVGSTTSDDGSNPRALQQLVQEIISNSADEALNGFGNEVILTIHEDNSVSISDKGRGIPAGDNFDDIIRAATVMHSSGKFDSESYNTSGGQNGIGLKACTALSKWLTVDAVTSVGDAYSITFQQEDVVKKSMRQAKKGEQTGTTITFLPDDTIFSTIDWDTKQLSHKLDTLAYITPGVIYSLKDNRPEEPIEKSYSHPDGMKDMVKAHAEGIGLVGVDEPLRIIGNYYFDDNNKAIGTDEDISSTGLTKIGVEVALAWTESVNEDIMCYTNGIPNKDGGPHLDGARSAISKVVSDYAKTNKLLKGKEKITSEDTRDGLVMVVSVSIPGNILQFESQTKEKLGTTQARVAVSRVLEDNLSKWFYDNAKSAGKIIERMKDASDAREAAAKARKASQLSRSSKSKKDIFDVSSKLVRSTAKNPKDRELVLVEGDSAGGSVIKGREIRKIKGKNSIIQAVLPLRGKVLNVKKAKKQSKILSNTEISTIIQVLGAGFGKDFDVEKLEYDKVVILADGDDDGAHIISLIITMFWGLMPELITQGHLYVAQPPLFRFDTYKNGKRIKAFALDNAEYDAIKDNYKGWNVTRLKGLGEMDATELSETVIKKGNRKLIRVTADKAIEANKQVDLLMGDAKDAAEKRRAWIEEVVNFMDNSEDDGASLSEISEEIETPIETVNEIQEGEASTDVSYSLRREAEEDFNYIELSDVLSATMNRYSKAAILRAIPDVRDGLKPVHRRILHTMNDNNWSPKSKHTKMAKVVGAVLAYHPHGDGSVFDAAVPMSQSWSFNVPYLDIDGNNGSPNTTKDWAASRYIEGRLSENITLLTTGLKENAVKMIPNYDNTEKEPVVMPAQYPALLTNGSEGMAVGFSTNIEPHSPVELLKAAELKNRKPEATLSEMMRFIKGPDLPTGGIIVGKDGIKDIYKKGYGKFVIRGKVEIEKNIISITELPYTVTRMALYDSIIDALAHSPVGNQVKHIADETVGEEKHVNIVIELDKKADVENFVNFLYKKSKLQVNFNANHYAIIAQHPKRFTLEEYMNEFLDFKRQTTRNVYNFELDKKQKRLHIVEGFIKLISTDVTEKVINAIKKSKGTREDAAKKIEKFGFSSEQALAIVSMQLYRINAQDLETLQKEESDLHDRIDFLETVLNDDEEFTQEISRLLKETIKYFKNYKRKTVIEDECEEVTVQETDFIEKNDVVVVVKPEGVQRMSEKVYNNNKSKWEGTVIGAIDTDTTQAIGMFTREGRFMQRLVHEIEHNSIVNPVEDLRKTVSTFKYTDEIIHSCTFPINVDTGLEVISVTAKGQVKRSKLDSSFFAFTQKGYLTRSNPYNGLKIKGDEVIWVKVVPTEEAENMTLRLIKNSKGRATLVKVKDLSIQGAAGSGVRGLNLKPNDKLEVHVK